MESVQELLQPLITGWMGKINQAIRARKEFDEIAEQCTAFFSGACGFMWKEKYQKRFFRGTMSPRFQITIQKAFELVALYGPSLYWQNPKRRVQPRRRLPISPQMLGLGTPEEIEQNPMLAQAVQQMMQQEGMEAQSAAMRAQLYEGWLNYTPDEQPGGGLAQHAEMAITEALVTGMGCLWSEWYSMPGSDLRLTGSTYDRNKNLLIDPDCENFDDAYWIARKRTQPRWEVERRFKLKPGSLNGHGHLESLSAQGEVEGDDIRNYHRAAGQTFDTVVYYEIFSRGGIGSRMTNVSGAMKEALDRIVGDYAYIVVCPGVPYPLNFPIDEVLANPDSDDDDVLDAFSWPAPFWKDKRWPVVRLTFYDKPGSPYPIAPMAPGLGELTFINAMIAHLANRIWSSSRNLIAVMESACKDLKEHLEKGEDMAVIPFKDVHQDIQKVMQIIQFPVVNMDAWQIIDRVTELFEKRTGMNAMLYSMNPGDVQSRSAADINVKQQYLQVRPDYMAKRVEGWQEQAARNERILSRWFIRPPDVQPLYGRLGAYLWQKEIIGQDPELVLREVDVTVEAGSMRKPNQQRDMENLNNFGQQILPVALQYSGTTGDWRPVEGFVQKWGDVNEMDVSEMVFQPPPPPPPPPEAQQQMQMEMAKLNAEVQGKQLDVEAKGLELQLKQMELMGQGAAQQAENAKRQMEFQFDAAKHGQGLQFEQERHVQESRQDADNFMRERHQKIQEFLLNLQQKRAEGALNLEQQKRMGEQKVAQAKAAAKAKPKPTANGNGKK